LSFTIDGERTRAGQPLADAFALAAGVDGVIAVGVNCCAPADVTPALRVAAEASGKPGVAYPNSGERWDARGRRWTGRASIDDGCVPAWTGAGARLVGGCCRVTPAHIVAMARQTAAARQAAAAGQVAMARRRDPRQPGP
jgi:homocysteine S-methyltransferase